MEDDRADDGALGEAAVVDELVVDDGGADWGAEPDEVQADSDSAATTATTIRRNSMARR